MLISPFSQVQRFRGSEVQGFQVPGSRFKVQGSGSFVAARSAWRLLSKTRMVARDFTELIAWQVAEELHEWVRQIVAKPVVARNRAFCDQFDDAAASGPRNIAAGFGRFYGKEFAQFLKIAIGSEMETRNHILDAFKRGYISSQERDHAVRLTRRAVTAAVRLREYLLSSRNPWK